MCFFMVKFMKRSLLEKIYIYLLMKVTDITNTDMYKYYTVIFKYDNTVDYFKHVTAFNKYDAKKIVKSLILLSDEFDIKDEKSLQIIVIKEDHHDEI